MLPLDNPDEQQFEQPVHQKDLQSLDLETVGTQTSGLETQTTSNSQTCWGSPSLTCSDTVHGIRSPEAFLPRDKLFKMD